MPGSFVKANNEFAGLDGQSIEDFEKNLGRNLYKIWNRMPSGTYLPPSVTGDSHRGGNTPRLINHSYHSSSSCLK